MLKCLFCWEIDSSENLCAAGTMHTTSEKVNEKHVQNFTEKLSEKALKLNDSHVLTKLSTGNVATNEIFYHKRCLKTFDNKYNAVVNSELKRK